LDPWQKQVCNTVDSNQSDMGINTKYGGDDWKYLQGQDKPI